jgi:hypothetical protein
MTSTRKLFLGLAIGFVASPFLLGHFGGRTTRADDGDGGVVIAGSGTFETHVTRAIASVDCNTYDLDTLPPPGSAPGTLPCLQLVARTGEAHFCGVISGDGTIDTIALRDGCTILSDSPFVQATALQTYTLVGVTVGGRTGNLTLEATGVGNGDGAGAGARNLYHFTVKGSGGLRGAHGEGIFAGNTTVADSRAAYFARIRFDD